MEDALFLKLLGKSLKYWEYRDALYAHLLKTQILFLLVNKFLLEPKCSLCKILANQLFLELNQLVKSYKETMLHLDTAQSNEILDLAVDLL